MRFQLVRNFTLGSLGMFLLVGAALTFFEHQQGSLFKRVQDQHSGFFRDVQASFAKRQGEVARRDLTAIHEAGNVNLTRVFANALWERDFAPFVAKAQAVDVTACRALPDDIAADGKASPSAQKKACFADIGARIMAIPGFRELDAKVFDTMKKSSVFKIKVFDLRGVTIYSSAHEQMGEDKSHNAGWLGAMGGKAASELTHRDKFSAFEGEVENRDLISSYLPVLEPGGHRIVGVFEIYSDVTPFLDRIKATSGEILDTAADNDAKVSQVAAETEAEVEASSTRAVVIVLALMGLLFASLFVIVRRAAGIIRQQEQDREHALQQLSQAEKMAALGQLVAGVAHQLNTPLAFSYNNVNMALEAVRGFHLPLKLAGRFSHLVKSNEGDTITVDVSRARSRVQALEDLSADAGMVTEMLGDTLQGIDQMRELVDNLREFTRLDRAKVSAYDLNKGLHNVTYIAKSVIPSDIQVIEDYGDIPPVMCNPSQLNQVFLNLINNAAQATAAGGTVTIRSAADLERVSIEVSDTGSGIAPEVLPHIFETYFTTKPAGQGTGLGLSIAKSIVEEHGGEITVATEVGQGSTFTVFLPLFK